MARSSSKIQGESQSIGGAATRAYVMVLFLFLHMNLNVFVFTHTGSVDETLLSLVEFFLHSLSYFGLLVAMLLVAVPLGQDLDDDEHTVWMYKTVAVGILAFGYAIVSEIAKFLVFGESLAGSLKSAALAFPRCRRVGVANRRSPTESATPWMSWTISPPRSRARTTTFAHESWTFFPT